MEAGMLITKGCFDACIGKWSHRLADSSAVITASVASQGASSRLANCIACLAHALAEPRLEQHWLRRHVSPGQRSPVSLVGAGDDEHDVRLGTNEQRVTGSCAPRQQP